MLKMTPSTIIDVKTLVADGATVMTERVDNFEVQGKPFGLEVAASSKSTKMAESTAGESTTTSPRYKNGSQLHLPLRADHPNRTGRPWMAHLPVRGRGDFTRLPRSAALAQASSHRLKPLGR